MHFSIDRIVWGAIIDTQCPWRESPMSHNKLRRDSNSTVSCFVVRLLLLILLVPVLMLVFSSCSFMDKAFSDDPSIKFRLIGGVGSSNSSNY